MTKVNRIFTVCTQEGDGTVELHWQIFKLHTLVTEVGEKKKKQNWCIPNFSMCPVAIKQLTKKKKKKTSNNWTS